MQVNVTLTLSICVVIGSCALAQSQEPIEKPPERVSPSSSTDKPAQTQGVMQAPALGVDQPDSSQGTDSTRTNNPPNQPDDTYSKWEAISTIAQGIASIVGILLGGAGVLFGIQANRTAKHALIMAERAWLSISFNNPPRFSGGEKPSFDLVLYNNGKSPAFLREFSGSCGVGSFEDLPNPPRFDPAKQDHMTIHPNQPLQKGELEGDITLTPGHAAAITAKRKLLLVWGYVGYHDIFSKDDPRATLHRTYFAAGWDAPAQQWLRPSDKPGYQDAD